MQEVSQASLGLKEGMSNQEMNALQTTNVTLENVKFTSILAVDWKVKKTNPWLNLRALDFMIYFQISWIDSGVVIQKPADFTNVLNVAKITIANMEKYVMDLIVLFLVLLKVPLIIK